MKMGKKKARRVESPPTGKVPRVSEPIEGLAHSNFTWRVSKSYIDMEHPDWGWGKLTIEQFFAILTGRLQDYEDMSWHDLLNRKSCHTMPVSVIAGQAQARLSDRCPDIDTLHQIDIGKMGRIWGFKDRQRFYLIWYDPNHTVYPTQGR
jgi:hypothetical protein